MSLGEDISTYLIAQGQATAIATDIFISYMPELPDTCVAVLEHPGPAPLVAGARLRVEQPDLQILVRAADYISAHNHIRRVWNALTNMPDGAVNGTRYLAVLPVAQPALMERDHAQRCVFYCNFSCTREVVIA